MHPNGFSSNSFTFVSIYVERFQCNLCQKILEIKWPLRRKINKFGLRKIHLGSNQHSLATIIKKKQCAKTITDCLDKKEVR